MPRCNCFLFLAVSIFVLRCFRCFLCKGKVKKDVTCMHMTQKRCCAWSRHGAEQIDGWIRMSAHACRYSGAGDKKGVLAWRFNSPWHPPGCFFKQEGHKTDVSFDFYFICHPTSFSQSAHSTTFIVRWLWYGTNASGRRGCNHHAAARFTEENGAGRAPQRRANGCSNLYQNFIPISFRDSFHS